MQKTDLEMWEVILAEELEHGLHPPDGRDLSTELDKAHTWMDKTTSDHATKVK
jgi:hypothetical protein